MVSEEGRDVIIEKLVAVYIKQKNTTMPHDGIVEINEDIGQ